MDLAKLGWNAFFQQHIDNEQYASYTVGRVMLEYKHLYRLYTETGEILGEVTGKLRHEALGREHFPAVGDWVVISVRDSGRKATIHEVLPRQSKFSRKTAGLNTDEQIVAANVDTVFLVNALNRDFNVRRIERYLILAWESGAEPVVVLSKADLCRDIEQKKAEVEAVASGVPIHVISSTENDGLEGLEPYLTTGRTVALLGSSGAGKSTLINRLVGRDVQRVREVREDDDRGKHTTTQRELLILPRGGLVMDTPGMRELQLWQADEGIRDTFDDIEELASHCRFRDCQHGNEPSCAVQQALNDGTLDSGRYKNYLKMQRELAYLARRENQKAQLAEKEKWKKITQAVRRNRRFNN